MKIAFYSPSWPAANAQNGIATYVDVMTRALARAGHECVVITPQLHDDAGENVYLAAGSGRKARRYLFERIYSRLTGDSLAFRARVADDIADALARASADGPIDFLEMEESFGWAAHVRKRFDRPLLMRTHGPHFLVHQGPLAKENRIRIRAEGKALSTCMAFSCPSDGLLRDIQARYNLPGHNASIVPNPVEFAADADSWRLDACDKNTILFVGRFDYVKGADLVLEAFADIAAAFPQARLVMAGKEVGMPDENGGLLSFDDYVRERIAPPVRERIEYLGPVSRDRLAALRKQALICVCASRFECFSYAVAEALALGCPVATTRAYGPPEFLAEDKDLLLADKGDARQLADCLARLLKDPSRAAEMARTGKASAMAHLSPEVVVKRYIAYCETVLNGASADAGKGA